MTRFLVAPQWQGSASARAMRLVDGAEAIAGDLPRAACIRLDVPLEAGDALGSGVPRLSALLGVRARIEEAVHAGADHAVVIGGDRGVAFAAAAAVAAADLALVWLDARAALHTPASSPSGAFAGMTLRALLGDGPDGMTLAHGAIGPDRVVLAGTRELDDAELAYASAAGIRMLPAEALAEPDALADAVAATGAARAFVHVDLGVLDPAAIDGLGSPVPFGAEPADVVASVRRLRERMPLAGASLTGFSPASPEAAVDDLGAILRIVGALA
jgi:arginase